MMKGSEHRAWLRNSFAMIAVVALLGLAVVPRSARAACTGDCNNSNTVTVDEILLMVNIALGSAQVTSCPAADANGSGTVTVDEILAAVNYALSQCPVAAACGDGVVEHNADPNLNEDCDDGGTCIGGSNAGTHCTAEAQCQGNGVCIGGSKAETACTAPADCPGGACVHCVPQGGDGCAANCTSETEIVTNLVDNVSGATVWNEVLGAISLPFVGAGETTVVGKAKNGVIPAIVQAASVHFPQIDVSGLACACVRGVAAKTCGGMLFNADGSAAIDCTPGYTTGDSLCTGGLPCAFVHGAGTGAGNSASGIISCAGNLEGVNLMFAQNSKGSTDPAQCNPSNPCAAENTCVPPNCDCWKVTTGSVPGLCGDPPAITLSGIGGPGSSVLLNTTAIGQAVGSCSNPANLPPNFCTDQEGFSTRGTPSTLPSVTGIAAGIMFGINGNDNDAMCNCPAGLNSCADNECTVNANHPGVCNKTVSKLCSTSGDCPSGEVCSGALAITGTPLPTCTDQLTSVSGLGLAGAFTSLSNPTIGDIVVTNLLKAQ